MKKSSIIAVLFATTLTVLGVAPVIFAEGPAATPNPAPTAVPTRDLATPLTEPTTNPRSSAFQIQVCDGPTPPKNSDGSYNAIGEKMRADFQAQYGREYRPCDFNAVMLLVQHLINILLVVGVLAAICMFVWAGWLFMSGEKGKIDKARSIFPKVFTGFIIMLSAWFIVYQILTWLTDEPAFRTLLGK